MINKKKKTNRRRKPKIDVSLNRANSTTGDLVDSDLKKNDEDIISIQNENSTTSGRQKPSRRQRRRKKSRNINAKSSDTSERCINLTTSGKKAKQHRQAISFETKTSTNNTSMLDDLQLYRTSLETCIPSDLLGSDDEDEDVFHDCMSPQAVSD